MKRLETPKRSANLNNIIDFYLDSAAYNRLKIDTQKDYALNLKDVRNTIVDNKALGAYKIKNIRVRHLTEAYDQWIMRGIRKANYNKSTLSCAWKHAMRYDVMEYNPITLVKTEKPLQRTVTWSRDDLTTFLDTAYQDFNTRNIALIVHMAYEWGQRIGDMRLLKWDTLDLEVPRLDIKQSKRGAAVHLPIGANLCKMLRQQKDDFGFQEYVAPRIVPSAGAYTPYRKNEIHKHINAVLEKANLPMHLTAMDLRRTAVTELLEANVDIAGIRQVTGHVNMQSCVPYMVNTYSGASKALAARGNDDEHS